MSKIIGIDLGSTLSEVAVMEGNEPTIIVNEEGERTTPSVISFGDNNERKVGSPAKRQFLTNTDGTVILIKRFMGGTYDEIKDNIPHVQYKVENVNGYPRVKIKEREYSPEELSSMILSKLKTVAENYLGEKVTDAVITVPAYFNNAQREATKKAGEIAGLNVRRLIAEPTAAILASKIDMSKGGKYMVVDYGGSTLDFSVADIVDGVVEIKASNGDVYCGGSDLDNLLVDYLVDKFDKENGTNLRKDSMAMQRIITAAETAKKDLSQQTSTEINLPYITAVDGMAKHMNETLTRAQFERIIDKEITKVINLGKEALKKADITANELDGVLLVGGSTRIPLVQSELIKAFGDKLIRNVNPDEAVALGAAKEAAILNGEKSDILLLDVTPLSLGIDTMGGVVAKIIDANTTIPCKRSQIFTTAADNQPAVTIMVVQGNRPMTADNKQIGVFTLDGIAPAMRGIPQIEVTFDIDSNGILSVYAKDKGTGKEQHITIESKGSLSDDEIERMKKEAEDYAEEDKKAKEKADTINGAEALAFSIEKTISELGEKITDVQKEAINPLISSVKDAVKEQDLDKVNASVEALKKEWNPIIESIYKESNPEEGTQSTFSGGNPFSGFTGGFNPNVNPFAQ